MAIVSQRHKHVAPQIIFDDNGDYFGNCGNKSKRKLENRFQILTQFS
jgi:hypothetical protein